MKKQEYYKKMLKEIIEEVEHHKLKTKEELYDKLIHELKSLHHNQPQRDKVSQ